MGIRNIFRGGDTSNEHFTKSKRSHEDRIASPYARFAVLESAGGTVTIIGDKHETQKLFYDLAVEKINRCRAANESSQVTNAAPTAEPLLPTVVMDEVALHRQERQARMLHAVQEFRRHRQQ